ncbi:MAG: hypothetical protein NTV01_17110 [Bacteroidia bacterium]|nr:hypothetical protein [Bacteroidia bacterium]
MKKRTIALSLLFTVLILSSCKKINDALTVKINTDFTVNLPVTSSSPVLKSPTAAFLSTATLDPLSNEDLAEYKDRINGFEVTGMTGTISNLSANVTLTDVKLKVSTPSKSTEWNFANLPLTNGSAVTFDNSASQWTKINEILGEQKEVTVTFSGNASQTNVTFNLQVTFTTVVTAKVL